MFATQKLKAFDKHNSLLTQGHAYAKYKITLRQEEKTSFECKCVSTDLSAIFFCYCNHHISETLSTRLLICYNNLFCPKTRCIQTTDNQQVLGSKTLKVFLITREEGVVERIICTELSLGFQTGIYRFGKNQEQKL